MHRRLEPDRDLREQLIAVACSVLNGRTAPAVGRQRLQEIQRRAVDRDAGAWHAAEAAGGICLRLEALPEIALPRSAWNGLMRWLAFAGSDLQVGRHVFWSMGRISVYALASLAVWGLSLHSAVAGDAWVFFGFLWLVFGLIWQELPLNVNGGGLKRARYVPFCDRQQWQRYASLAAELDVPSYAEHCRSGEDKLAAYRTSQRPRLSQILLLPGILFWRSLPRRRIVWLVEEKAE